MLQAGRSRVQVPLNFSIYLILPGALCPGVDSASNRNEYQAMFLGSRAQPERKAGNLTDICELSV
jgi:hypothetical protein